MAFSSSSLGRAKDYRITYTDSKKWLLDFFGINYIPPIFDYGFEQSSIYDSYAGVDDYFHSFITSSDKITYSLPKRTYIIPSENLSVIPVPRQHNVLKNITAIMENPKGYFADFNYYGHDRPSDGFRVVCAKGLIQPYKGISSSEYLPEIQRDLRDYASLETNTFATYENPFTVDEKTISLDIFPIIGDSFFPASLHEALWCVVNWGDGRNSAFPLDYYINYYGYIKPARGLKIYSSQSLYNYLNSKNLQPEDINNSTIDFINSLSLNDFIDTTGLSSYKNNANGALIHKYDTTGNYRIHVGIFSLAPGRLDKIFVGQGQYSFFPEGVGIDNNVTNILAYRKYYAGASQWHQKVSPNILAECFTDVTVGATGITGGWQVGSIGSSSGAAGVSGTGSTLALKAFFDQAEIPDASYPGWGIEFTDLSVPQGYPIVEWQWNFGDGSTSDLQNPYHQYSSNGTYLVSLDVVDEKLNTHTYKKNIIINNTINAKWSEHGSNNITPLALTDNANKILPWKSDYTTQELPIPLGDLDYPNGALNDSNINTRIFSILQYGKYISPGDIIFAFVNVESNLSTPFSFPVTPPPGWTQIGTPQYLSGTGGYLGQSSGTHKLYFAAYYMQWDGIINEYEWNFATPVNYNIRVETRLFKKTGVGNPLISNAVEGSGAPSKTFDPPDYSYGQTYSQPPKSTIIYVTQKTGITRVGNWYGFESYTIDQRALGIGFKDFGAPGGYHLWENSSPPAGSSLSLPTANSDFLSGILSSRGWLYKAFTISAF